MAKQCNQKTVLVSVYTEGPRWRNMILSGNHEHGGHHHLHHFVQNSNNKEVTMFKIGDSGVDHRCKGYNRRAELLLYSQRLRASSADQHEDRSYFLKPKPNSPKQSATNTVAGRKKAKGSKTPGCVEKCEISMSSFCRSVKNVEVGNMAKRKKHSTGSKNNAMKSAMKSLQMRKNKGLVAKMLEKVQKYR